MSLIWNQASLGRGSFPGAWNKGAGHCYSSAAERCMCGLRTRAQTRRPTTMAIEDRNLSIGTKLWARYKGETYTAEVAKKEGETGDDPILYKLADGREFKSPSAAGTAITTKACNGW